MLLYHTYVIITASRCHIIVNQCDNIKITNRILVTPQCHNTYNKLKQHSVVQILGDTLTPRYHSDVIITASRCHTFLTKVMTQNSQKRL